MYRNYNIIPIGDHCAVSIILKELEIRNKSYPFDWITNKEQLFDTNIIYNINFIREMQSIDNIKTVVSKYIGNAFNTDNKVNTNNMWFPHDSENIKDIFDKYERRFRRLFLDLQNEKNMFVLLTRHYYISEEEFGKIMTLLMGYNKDNIILFISGTNHEYLTNNMKYENVIFKHIFYDITKFYAYDYSSFRPQLKEYLAQLLL